MTKPIRVLQVLGRLDRGGAETMIMNLYRRMDREKVQFDFVLHTEEECAYGEEVRSLGGRIYTVPEFRGTNLFAYRKAWKRFLKEHGEYRILHSHIRSTASLYLPLAKKRGMITVIHSHNTSSGKGVGAFVKTVLQYPLRFQADYLFACSMAAGQWLYGKKACGKPNFYLLKNAIDLDRFSYREENRRKIRKKLGVGEDCFIVGHIGRFEPQKNHGFLLQIFESICEIKENAKLLLLGEGALEKEIKKSAGENVYFAGVQEHVEEWMSAMDVFVFPSLFEGLPLTLMEAQAAGLPAVVSDSITEEAVLTESVSFMSLQEDAEKWAKAAVAAAQTERDSGKAGRLLREQGYDISETTCLLQQFYQEQWEKAHV